MKFMMLQKDIPEYVSQLREYLGREYDLGATMKEIRHGLIINKDGSVVNKAIMVCFDGSPLSGNDRPSPSLVLFYEERRIIRERESIPNTTHKRY